MKRVQAFFANYDFGVAKDSLSEIIESINTNIRWMEKNYNAVVKFLILNNSGKFDFFKSKKENLIKRK